MNIDIKNTKSENASKYSSGNFRNDSIKEGLEKLEIDGKSKARSLGAAAVSKEVIKKQIVTGKEIPGFSDLPSNENKTSLDGLKKDVEKQTLENLEKEENQKQGKFEKDKIQNQEELEDVLDIVTTTKKAIIKEIENNREPRKRKANINPEHLEHLNEEGKIEVRKAIDEANKEIIKAIKELARRLKTQQAKETKEEVKPRREEKSAKKTDIETEKKAQDKLNKKKQAEESVSKKQAKKTEKEIRESADKEIKKYFPEEEKNKPLKSIDEESRGKKVDTQPEVTREFLDPEWESREKKLEKLKQELNQASDDYVEMKLKKEKLWKAPMRFFREKITKEKDQDVEWMKEYYNKALARYQNVFLERLDRKKMTEKDWDDAHEYFEKEEKINLYNAETNAREEEHKFTDNKLFKFVGRRFENLTHASLETKMVAIAAMLVLGAFGGIAVENYMRGKPGLAKLVKERIAELKETELSESLLKSFVSEEEIKKELPGELAESVSESENVPEDISESAVSDEIKEGVVKEEAIKKPGKPGEGKAEKVAKQKAPETIVVSGEFEEAVSELSNELTGGSAEAWKYIKNKTSQQVRDLIRAMPREKVEEMDLKGLIERLNDISYRYTREHSVKANPEKGEVLGHWIKRIVEINKEGKL